MMMLERFLHDSRIEAMDRKGTSSTIGVEDVDVSLPILSNMERGNGTDLCLIYRDRVISVCREFTKNTVHMCSLIERTEIPTTNAVALAFFINNKKNFIQTIVKAGELAEKELLSLYKNFKKEEKSPFEVTIQKVKTKSDKRTSGKQRLSTIKRSHEEFTDDELILVEGNMLAESEKKESVVDEFESLLQEALGVDDVGTSLLTVKEENKDDEVLSGSTGVAEPDNLTDLCGDTAKLQCTLDDKGTRKSGTADYCSEKLKEECEADDDLSVDFGVNHSADTEKVSQLSGDNGALTNLSADTEKLDSAQNTEEVVFVEGIDNSIIDNYHVADQTDETTLKESPKNAVNKDKLICKKRPRTAKKRLTKQEITEQLALLDEMWDSSYSDISNCFLSHSSDSESDYDRISHAKRQKFLKKSDESTNIVDESDLFSLNPCSVKITRDEQNVCDDFYYGHTPKRCLTSNSSDSTSESDDLIKPMKNRHSILSSSDETDVNDTSSNNSLNSENELGLLQIPCDVSNQYEDDENVDYAILNGIVDSDSVSWTSDESDEESDAKIKSKKKKCISVKKEIDEKSEWKWDSLLTDRLEEDEKKTTKEQFKRDNSNDDTEDESEEDENIFEVESTASDSSDIEFVDVSQESNSGKGRKNIRAVLSEDTLEQSTIEAGKQEREHVERLKEKRRNLEKIRNTLKETCLVLDATGDITIEVNSNLTKRLKSHQSKGVQFMWDACYETVNTLKTHPGAGCILAHCMGLGKTFQCITLVHTLFKYSDVTRTKHVLVICPLSTVYNWKNEFCIAIDVAEEDTIQNIHTITDQQKCPMSKIQIVKEWRNSGGILIMCYEAFVSFTVAKPSNVNKQQLIKNALINPGADLLICDEGHQLKNIKTQRAQMLSQVRTKRRIILTGTPIQNNLKEYYWMVNFVKPNLLGTYKEFLNRFANPIVNGQYDDSTAHDINLMRMRSHVLHSILKNTMQRIEAKELKKYLPNKHDYVLFVKLHSVQAEMYKACLHKITSMGNRWKLFMNFTALRPTWFHPYALFLRDEKTNVKPVSSKKKSKVSILNADEEILEKNDLPKGWWKDLSPPDYETNMDYGSKLTIMMSIIKECESVGDKLLIFTQFLLDLDLIEKFLKLSNPSWTHGINYYRMDGRLSMEMRERYCQKFNEKDNSLNIFLLTHKVGGLGLNLASANRVILMDCCWNPANSEQSIFRVYRFGQVKECYIYRLVSMGTMEEVLYERSVTKQAVSNRVIDEMQVKRHYKSSDLLSLYRCQVHVSEEPPIPKLPADKVLARLLQLHKGTIHVYHEHQNLLANLEDEELNENEIKLAWENFIQANNSPPPPPQAPFVTHAQPGTTVQQQCRPSTSYEMPRLLPLNQASLQRVRTNLSNIPQPNPYFNNMEAIKRKQNENQIALKDTFFNSIDLCKNNNVAQPSVIKSSENYLNNSTNNGTSMQLTKNVQSTITSHTTVHQSLTNTLPKPTLTPRLFSPNENTTHMLENSLLAQTLKGVRSNPSSSVGSRSNVNITPRLILPTNTTHTVGSSLEETTKGAQSGLSSAAGSTSRDSYRWILPSTIKMVGGSSLAEAAKSVQSNTSASLPPRLVLPKEGTAPMVGSPSLSETTKGARSYQRSDVALTSPRATQLILPKDVRISGLHPSNLNSGEQIRASDSNAPFTSTLPREDGVIEID